jgi:hypothetical protein
MTPAKRSRDERLGYFVRRLQVHAAKGEHAFNEHLVDDPSAVVFCAAVLHYQAGRHDAAAKLLASYEAGPDEMITLDTPLCDSPLGIRTANLLTDGLGAVTFGDLRGVTEAKLRGVPNIGEKLAESVKALLAEAVRNS